MDMFKHIKYKDFLNCVEIFEQWHITKICIVYVCHSSSRLRQK